MTRYERCQQIIEGFRREARAQQEHNARMQSNPYWAFLTALRCAQAAAMYTPRVEAYTELNECELEQRVKLARETA